MPTCVKCGSLKPDNEFYRRSSGILRRDCKKCHRAAAAIRERADPAAHAARVRRYRAANMEQERIRNRAYRKRRPEVGERARKKYRYGLTSDAYEALWFSQGGCCKICQLQEVETSRGLLFVDHCHSSGGIRGLLCNNCNALLGMAGDSPEVLRRGAAYLEACQ